MNKIKLEYDDIIKEVLPSNFMNVYSFKHASDIKLMEHTLKKSFKRFGLSIEEGANFNQKGVFSANFNQKSIF